MLGVTVQFGTLPQVAEFANVVGGAGQFRRSVSLDSNQRHAAVGEGDLISDRVSWRNRIWTRLRQHHAATRRAGPG
jgi:hypothetical protein